MTTQNTNARYDCTDCDMTFNDDELAHLHMERMGDFVIPTGEGI